MKYTQRALAEALGTNHTRLQRFARKYPEALPEIVDGGRRYYSEAQLELIRKFISAHGAKKKTPPPEDNLFVEKPDLEELPKAQDNNQRMVKATVPADKLSQKLFLLNETQFNYALDGNALKCVEGNKKGKKISTSFWLKNAEDFLDRKPLNPFHRELLFMLISSYEQGYRVATYHSVFNAMTGDYKSRMHDEQYEAIKDAVDKLRGTLITIDSRELRKAFPKYDKANIEVTISDYLLPCRLIEASYNGQRTLVIEMRGESPLMTYAKLKNQMQGYELKGLDVPRQRNTPLVMVIKGYLRRWVDAVINRRLNPTLTKETFNTNCGLAEADKWKRQDARKIIGQVLNQFVAEKIITSWHWTKNGNAYEKITIEYESGGKHSN